MSNAKPKWDDLTYREMPVRDHFDYMRCQVGREIATERRGPIFILLGHGRTMLEAEQMAERRLRR